MNITALATAVAPALYNPWQVVVFVLCAGLVVTGPQSWNFTQRLTPVRAVVCLTLFASSVVFLWTQTVNPFLYFQF